VRSEIRSPIEKSVAGNAGDKILTAVVPVTPLALSGSIVRLVSRYQVY